MKKSEDNMPNDLDNVEDLTLFADESFDTNDVDLFEFTGDSESPLTRLKSIILSLDWEISDNILQELIEEVDNLKQVWQGDKVAQVYLQGLHKIGNYLRAEGAYSHPNAIKLLLSFFYNFEKIISSETITDDTITSLLKADVRKFKILQYQINQKASISQIVTEESSDELAVSEENNVAETPECEPLTCLKATILGLEWEVTDKGLDQFNSQIADIREHFINNKSAQILIQGLQALGGYITDERGDAHPEAFSLLHSFYEGLELLLDEKNIDKEEKQNVLIDRVNRLNALKAVIAETKTREADKEEIIDEVIAPMSSEEEVELLDTKTQPAAIEPEEAPADTKAHPAATEPEEAPADEEAYPAVTEPEEALADVEDYPAATEPESAPADAEMQSAATELEEAFADMETPEKPEPDDFLDPSAITPVEDKIADDFIGQELHVGGTIAGETTVSGGEEEIDILEEKSFAEEQFEEELDLFFSDDEKNNLLDAAGDEDESSDDEVLEDLELTLTEEEFDLDFSDENIELPDETIADEIEETDDKFEQLFVEEEDTGLQPALADAGDEGGFDETAAASTLPEAPSDEIDGKLDNFFGPDEKGEKKEEGPAAPALADIDEEGGFDETAAASTLPEAPSDEIDDTLDAFFGPDEEEEKKEEEPAASLESVQDEPAAPALADIDEEGGFNEDEAVATMTEAPSAEIEDKLDAFFGPDEEEEKKEEEPAAPPESVHDEPAAPALADTDEEGGFNEDETVATMTEEPGPEIEDKLDAFFGLDTETPPPVTEETDVDKSSQGAELLATLGAGLTAFAAKGTVDHLRESKTIVEQLRDDSTLSAEHKVLLQLLESTLTLIPEEEGKKTDGMEKITELGQTLQQQLEKNEITSLDLCRSIGHTVSILAAEIIDLRNRIK